MLVDIPFYHPFYQEIKYRDLMSKASYPDKIKTERDENLTWKTLMGDFLLEQKIKRQELAPKRIVEKKTWQRITRSVDKVEEIYENASGHLKIIEKS